MVSGDDRRVDDARIGRALRVLRQRRGLRQVDVAAPAGVSQGTISLIERGHLDALSVRTLRQVFGAVGAGFDATVQWRAGALDRLLDERHAALVGEWATRLRAIGWDVAIEVTYSVYGERGSIDLLAGHGPTRTLLVTEVKSELTSIEQTARKIDEKARIAAGRLCQERFGWRPRSVGRLLVLPDTDAARRAVARNARLLDILFRARGQAVRSWLRDPRGDVSGVLFVADTNGSRVTGQRRGATRIRRSTRPPS